MEFMRTLGTGSIDAVITDPPYGVGLKYGGQFKDTTDNLYNLLPQFLSEAQRIAHLVVFPSGQFEIETWLMQNYPPRWRMCWYKCPQSTASPIGFSDFELMFVYGDKIYHQAHDYFYIRPETNQNLGHPCPKPVGWSSWLIDRLTLNSAIVLDPFMGSGTTGVACVQTGRNFIGCEISEDYFKVAQKRISEAQMQMRLPFEVVGK